MKILVADDHDIIRFGLQQLLEQAFPSLEFAEAATGQGVLDKIADKKWDVVILDLILPDIHGLDVLKQIKLVRPALPVIIFSFYPAELYGRRAYKSGASAYLDKQSVTKELIIAINQVVDGRKYVSPAFSEQIADQLERPVDEPPAHVRLSDRELEILCLLAKGQTPSEIAERLLLSVKTVSTYRKRVLEKLHLTTTPALMKYAFDYKLIE